MFNKNIYFKVFFSFLYRLTYRNTTAYFDKLDNYESVF